MFDATEMNHFRRFASALDATVMPSGQIRPGGERAASAVAKALDLLVGAVAFKVGGPAAAGAAYGARVGQRAIGGGLTASRARGSFQGGAPRAPLPQLPPPDLSRLGAGAGLSVGAGS